MNATVKACQQHADLHWPVHSGHHLGVPHCLGGAVQFLRTERQLYFHDSSQSLDNFQLHEALHRYLHPEFPRMFTNTLIIAICSCLLSVFFTISVAYCMSRLRFKLRKPFMNIAMILGLFPGFMAMVAVYFILQSFGLTEGSMIKVALILVYLPEPV